MKKLIFSILLVIMMACDSFEGCGPIVTFNQPEPQYTVEYIDGRSVRMPTGRYYYSVSIKGDDGENHKVYVSYNTWVSA